jgi:hypothetical protein
VDASGTVIGSDVALASKTISYSAADAVGAMITLRKSRGTSAAPTAHNASDVLGALLFQGRSASAYVNAGQIRYVALSAGGTDNRCAVESTIHDGLNEVTTGNFRRFKPATTTDATPVTLESIAIPNDSTVSLVIVWHGQQGSNIAHRETALTIRRSGSGNIVEISHSDSVPLFKDVAGWGSTAEIVYVLNNTSHTVDINAKGAVSTTVVWTGSVAQTIYT